MTEKYDALADRLGAERSTRVRYQKAHDAQQKRIRELEALLSEAHDMIHALSDAWSDTREADNMRRAAAILKGAK